MSSPSLLFMVKPSAEVRFAMQRVLSTNGWDRELGSALFAPENWHQSISAPLPSFDEMRDCLLDIGARIQAVAFTIVLDRLDGSGSEASETIHWTFRATRRPPAFEVLQDAIREHLKQDAGLEGLPRHTPHVTVSYWAPHRIASTRIRPIAWRVDELLLVESRNAPYRYHTLANWPLQHAPAGLESQMEIW